MQFFQLVAAFTSMIVGMVHPLDKQPISPVSTQEVLAAEVTPLPTVTPIPLFSITPTPPTVSLEKKKVLSVSTKDPLVDCVGPDGKHFHATQKACDEFNKAWAAGSISAYPTSPYGQATKVAEHTYELKLPPDISMAGAQEIFNALNAYRQKRGIAPLAWSNTLANYAQSRADFYTSKGSLDSHAGFMDFVNNQDGFKKLGFNHIGENAAYAGPLNGTHLIEWVFAADEEHNSNQLNTEWKSVGIGVSGVATDVIFASSPQ